jgi:pyrroloquinoline-quinone synthase
MTSDLISQIDQIVQSRSLLEHPFYQDWAKGTLPFSSLQEYAAQYYHFELAYPTFLSGLHHRCTDQATRQSLLENLWDEEHGPDNHVELWLRFCDSLGLERRIVRSEAATSGTVSLVDTYRQLTSAGPLAAGTAALYAYESQVPQIAKAKLQGLRQFYGMDGDNAVSFFLVHQELDADHAEAERGILVSNAGTLADEESVLEAVDRATEALWGFLDGVYAR